MYASNARRRYTGWYFRCCTCATGAMMGSCAPMPRCMCCMRGQKWRCAAQPHQAASERRAWRSGLMPAQRLLELSMLAWLASVSAAAFCRAQLSSTCCASCA